MSSAPEGEVGNDLSRNRQNGHVCRSQSVKPGHALSKKQEETECQQNQAQVNCQYVKNRPAIPLSTFQLNQNELLS